MARIRSRRKRKRIAIEKNRTDIKKLYAIRKRIKRYENKFNTK